MGFRTERKDSYKHRIIESSVMHTINYCSLLFVLKIHFDLAKIGLGKAMHLWNCDETSFNDDKDNGKEITRRGAKRPLVLTGNNENINLIIFNCVNTDGFLLPPFVVYKSKIDFMTIGLKEAHQTHFTQHHYLVGWKVIINVSLSVALKCKENTVTLICFPAHSLTFCSLLMLVYFAMSKMFE